MTRRSLLHRVCLGGATALSLVLAGPGHAETATCAAPPELTEISVGLPHLAARLRNRQPVTIVAIGGASTRGAAAGAPDRAYPARLQRALAAFYPGVAITVINKGVPRQTAQQMVARFAADVFAEHPNLVVWETGTVDAVRDVAVDDFAAALQAGIDELKKQAIDILLVDMQFSHRTTAVIDFERYLRTIHRVGEINEVYVFPRFEMMRYWSEQNVFNFEEVTDSERATLAAKVYECIGRRLAQAIRSAAQ